MRRAAVTAWLLGLLGAMPLSAQEAAVAGAAPTAAADGQLAPAPQTLPAPEAPASTCDAAVPAEASLWQAPWGLAALRIIPDGPKIAPNGAEYHPNFSMDVDFNWWIWRSQRLYMFADVRLWGEKGEYGATNSNDGFLATSKRQIDLSGGAAWNYEGPWEARASGYSINNLNRDKGSSLSSGSSTQVTPSGFNDGSLLENRYYLSPEYAKLGQPGFDVARATFLSVGYYPTKDLIGNDGQTFKPGLMLRAYLIQDLWDWPCYAFGDATFISERSLRPKLLLFDVGLAARPFHWCPQCEFRLGVENTADLQVNNVLNLWYASFRYIF